MVECIETITLFGIGSMKLSRRRFVQPPDCQKGMYGTCMGVDAESCTLSTRSYNNRRQRRPKEKHCKVDPTMRHTMESACSRAP